MTRRLHRREGKGRCAYVLGSVALLNWKVLSAVRVQEKLALGRKNGSLSIGYH